MKHDKDNGYVVVPHYLTDFLAADRRFHDAQYLSSAISQQKSSDLINTMKTELGKILAMPLSMYNKRILYQIYEYDPLKDSSNMCSSDWIRIATDIETYYNNYDAFIVMQGTDTMAYSASALSFLLENLGKTVIFTGSQIPFAEVRNDAYDNFLGALTLAGHYVIPEVTLFFQNRLLRGNRSSKVNAVDFEAFDSPNLKPLAQLSVNIQIEWDEILKGHVPTIPNGSLMSKTSILSNNPISYTYTPVFRAWKVLNDNVCSFRLFPGVSASAIRAFTVDPIKGLVLESFGTGNAPDDRPDLLDAIRDAVKRGIVIVNISQCKKGSAYQLYANGHVLSRAGVVMGHDMTAECALTKLSYLLSNPSYDYQTVCHMMREPIRGELTVPPVIIHSTQESIYTKVMTSAIKSCDHDLRPSVDRILRPIMMRIASNQGNVQTLQELISANHGIRGANHLTEIELDLEHKSEDGRTCLHIAVASGDLETVKWCLSHGSKAKTTDKSGNSTVSMLKVCRLYSYTRICHIHM